ncbi:hypothetical protein BDV38DRAFT_283524 [Aspergillus pseudotamarii]|uniref:Uncharacterized protein n=1 Tax=Aspergillus pseudotamarii TaxID=132259 RepID=A0A5N6SSP6_ASPPS|nr:uncharacterized protein BDV38DRAFT_283524 [Aspergillus pseudotamarii]KAE8136849.1 hypothetical protein BDV38DRAFT_283524 [Aspergillus pseudotamarii]
MKNAFASAFVLSKGNSFWCFTSAFGSKIMPMRHVFTLCKTEQTPIIPQPAHSSDHDNMEPVTQGAQPNGVEVLAAALGEELKDLTGETAAAAGYKNRALV